MSFRALVLTITALALVALALRVVRLGERPPHTDEAVNAWILGRVLAGKPFAFDPRDRHGPLLPAAGLVTAGLLGRRTFADLDERAIRLAPAVMGAAATGLFLLGSGLLPHGVLAGSAALWAVSPLPLYYARYAIHETLLVAATLAFLLMLARACLANTTQARVGWAVGVGCAAGAMLAAKLSALLPFAATALAALAAGRPLAGARAANSARTGFRERTSDLRRAFTIAAVALATAALTTAFAYTWGFSRAAGLRDLVFGMGEPLARAAGQGHGKAPLYFAGVLGLGASGVVFLLLALVGAFVAWRRGGRSGRCLVVYAVVLTALHSAIPYKTPWLALGLFLPLAVLAAWTVASLVQVGTALRAVRVGSLKSSSSLADASERRPYLRAAAWLGVFAFAGLTAHADYRYVYAEPAAETNPLAYAHTSPDLRRITSLIDSLPTDEPLVAVYMEDAWPLPFILRHESRVGYWQPGPGLPADADLIITTVDTVATLDTRYATWRPHYFTQRPGVILVALQNPTTEASAAR